MTIPASQLPCKCQKCKWFGKIIVAAAIVAICGAIMFFVVFSGAKLSPSLIKVLLLTGATLLTIGALASQIAFASQHYTMARQSKPSP